MKINYPIKYALMPIVEQVGWTPGLHELEREYDIVCYIVSKCHLIGNSKKYTEDGHCKEEYEVVFPYQHFEFNRWRRVIPSYNLIHGYCTNSNKVDEVFDTYEEALNYAEIQNEILCKKTSIYLPYTEDLAKRIQMRKDAFYSKLTEYKKLEQQMLLYTADLDVGSGKELRNVIKLESNDIKVLSCGIYEVLRLFDDRKFVVYSVSQEQHDMLIELKKQGNVDDVKSVIGNVRGLALHKTKDDFIKLAIEEGCGAYYLENECISYDINLDKVTKTDFEKLDDDTLVFYTTETVDDLLSSYRKYAEIDLDEDKGPVLKKVNNKKKA